MNILIVEDENKTAGLLKDLIESEPDCLVVNICESISAAVAYLEKNQSKLDLIFMDIQLADGESFEIFRQTEVTLPVVFYTAYNEYVLEAFKNNGIDYILKPFRREDIQATLKKVHLLRNSFTSFREFNLQQMASGKKYQTSFIVHFREKMIPLAVADIAFIYLENESVHVIKFNEEKSVIFKTLDEVEKALDPADFFRINRQMIINRNAIRDIEPYFNRKVIVNLKVKTTEKPIVSRLKVSTFKTWIEKSE